MQERAVIEIASAQRMITGMEVRASSLSMKTRIGRWTMYIQ